MRPALSIASSAGLSRLHAPPAAAAVLLQRLQYTRGAHDIRLGSGGEAHQHKHRDGQHRIQHVHTHAAHRNKDASPSKQQQQQDTGHLRKRHTSGLALEAAAAEAGPAGPAVPTWRHMLSAQGFKDVLKKYGVVAVTFHASVFATTFLSLYAALAQGVDVTAALSHVPLIDVNELLASSGAAGPAAGKFAVAYGATLLTGPPRAVLTIVATPKVANVWHAHIKPRPAPILNDRGSGDGGNSSDIGGSSGSSSGSSGSSGGGDSVGSSGGGVGKAAGGGGGKGDSGGGGRSQPR